MYEKLCPVPQFSFSLLRRQTTVVTVDNSCYLYRISSQDSGHSSSYSNYAASMLVMTVIQILYSKIRTGFDKIPGTNSIFYIVIWKNKTKKSVDCHIPGAIILLLLQGDSDVMWLNINGVTTGVLASVVALVKLLVLKYVTYTKVYFISDKMQYKVVNVALPIKRSCTLDSGIFEAYFTMLCWNRYQEKEDITFFSQ